MLLFHVASKEILALEHLLTMMAFEQRLIQLLFLDFLKVFLQSLKLFIKLFVLLLVALLDFL
jgi:hypothetical protein